MYTILKSILDRPAVDVQSLLEQVLKTDALLPEERDYFEYVELTLASGHTATEQMLVDQFPAAKVFLDESPRWSVQEARIHLSVVTEERARVRLSNHIHDIADQTRTTGLTDDLSVELRRLRVQTSPKAGGPASYDFSPDAHEDYQNIKERPVGLQTFVQQVDKAVGGLNYGSLNIIMGFTGQFKSTWALNIAYNNAIHYNYWVAYMSLEMTRADLRFNLLSRHSYDPKFGKYSYIPHDRIRRGELSDEEEDYLFNVVAPDLDAQKGKIIIVDASDLGSGDLDDIYAKMEEIDDQFMPVEGAGSQGIDAFIWDHLQMLKFKASKMSRRDDNELLNAAANQIMQWAIDFRGRPTIQLLLAQTNREGWRRAVKNSGAYDLTALAEVNEAERAATRVFSVFADPAMVARGGANVTILKSRFGKVVASPIPAFVDPQCCVFGEDGPAYSVSQNQSQNQFAALMDFCL